MIIYKKWYFDIFFLTQYIHREWNQRKKSRDEEEKYFKTAHMYILCKKTVSKYHFLRWWNWCYNCLLGNEVEC
jgi:hypothetical protein